MNQTFRRERFLQNFISSLKAMQELVSVTGETWKYPHFFSCLLCLLGLIRQFGLVPTLFFSYLVLFYFDAHQSAKIQPEEQQTHFR